MYVTSSDDAYMSTSSSLLRAGRELIMPQCGQRKISSCSANRLLVQENSVTSAGAVVLDFRTRSIQGPWHSTHSWATRSPPDDLGADSVVPATGQRRPRRPRAADPCTHAFRLEAT